MKNPMLTAAALLVVALAAWPAVAGGAPAGAPTPEALAPGEISEPVPGEEAPAGLDLDPLGSALALGNCNCPDIYDPVCGSDGVTYSNACVARCNGVRKFTEGECGSTS